MTQQEALAMKNRITQLESENQRLQQQVSYLQKHLFGRKTEKTSVIFDGQINLFNEAEQEAKKKPVEPDLQTIREHRRKKTVGQREKLLENLPIHVKEKEYEKFRKVYQKRDKVKMYLAHGYKKRHCYDSETMETQEYKMGEHDGVLLIYELPDTVKEKKTEAEAYAAVWDIMMELHP